LLEWNGRFAPGAEWRFEVQHESLPPLPLVAAHSPQKQQKVTHEAPFCLRDVKNEGRTDYVYENKGSGDKMSCVGGTRFRKFDANRQDFAELAQTICRELQSATGFQERSALFVQDRGGENACLPESISRPYARVPYYIYAGISRDVYENKGT